MIMAPDFRPIGFAEECRQQSLSLKDDHQEVEILGWLDSIADREDWQ